MKIAHLIMAHKGPELVEKLVRILSIENCDIFIHIDKKVDIDAFKILTNYTNVKFIRQRIDIKWGGYSQVKATLVSLEEILEHIAEYDYINFISGQDYPIKPMGKFYDFLKTHQGEEFMEFHLAEDRPEVTRKRIYKYNFSDYTFKGKYLLQKIVNLILPEKKFPISNYTIVWKANWFTITPKSAHYVLKFLKENPKVVNFFKYCWGVDEFVFQTILYNSEFKEKIVNNNLRYVDWSANKASPKTLDISDWDQLSKSDNFFARKFDLTHDKEIISKIDNEIHKL